MTNKLANQPREGVVMLLDELRKLAASGKPETAPKMNIDSRVKNNISGNYANPARPPRIPGLNINPDIDARIDFGLGGLPKITGINNPGTPDGTGPPGGVGRGAGPGQGTGSGLGLLAKLTGVERPGIPDTTGPPGGIGRGAGLGQGTRSGLGILMLLMNQMSDEERASLIQYLMQQEKAQV